MKSRLNELPVRILKQLKTKLEAKSELFNPYPQDIYLIQDQSLEHYIDLIKATVFPTDNGVKRRIEWQLRQLYRIVNAMISSENASIRPFKQVLLIEKLYLEQQEVINTILNKIQSKELKPDVVISGHGCWYSNEGYVNFSSVETKVVVYAPWGAKLSAEFADDVENQIDLQEGYILRHLFNHQEILLKPTIFNCFSPTSLPNFATGTDKDAKARLVETFTGRILEESSLYGRSQLISINEVILKYPDRTTHYAACLGIKDPETHNNLGSGKDYKVFPFHRKKSNTLFFKVEDGQSRHAIINTNTAASRPSV